MGYNCLFIDIGVTISRRSDYSVAFKGLLDGQLYLVDFNDNKESEEPSQAQDQPSSSIQASPPTQDEKIAQEEEDEDQDDEPPQEEDIDQGEMKMNKTMKMIKKFGIKDHHTQVSTKQFKEITPSTPFLVTFTRGND